MADVSLAPHGETIQQHCSGATLSTSLRNYLKQYTTIYNITTLQHYKPHHFRKKSNEMQLIFEAKIDKLYLNILNILDIACVFGF